MLHVASPLHFHLRQAGIAAMQNIATTSDDLENREINEAEIYGVQPKWTYGGGARSGTEEAF
jgi:hypothetical protein